MLNLQNQILLFFGRIISLLCKKFGPDFILVQNHWTKVRGSREVCVLPSSSSKTTSAIESISVTFKRLYFLTILFLWVRVGKGLIVSRFGGIEEESCCRLLIKWNLKEGKALLC